MKTCPYCAEQIQGTAIKCRYCGSDLTVREKPSHAPAAWHNAQVIVAVIISALILMYFAHQGDGANPSPEAASASTDSSATTPPDRPELQFTAVALNALFKANEVSANQQIGNAIVTITGDVTGISQSDIGGAPYLSLATDESYHKTAKLLARTRSQIKSELNSTDPTIKAMAEQTIQPYEQQLSEEGQLNSMRADLDSSQGDAAAKLKIGQEVKLRCSGGVSLPAIDVDASGCVIDDESGSTPGSTAQTHYDAF